MEVLSNIKILVVEDDREISALICKVLSKEKYNIVQALDGKSAMDKYQFEGEFQLIIIDLMIPFIDGFEIIRRIRQKSIVPILVISARSDEMDKVSAISMGADDYIIKPFSLNEFVARIKSLLRRYLFFSNEESIKEQVIQYKNLVVDMKMYSIMKKGKLIKTTPIEFEIFKLFLQNPTKVFTKSQIYDSVWGRDVLGNDNTVMVHIKRLRDKIEDNTENQEYITTVWGIGYKLGE